MSLLQSGSSMCTNVKSVLYSAEWRQRRPGVSEQPVDKINNISSSSDVLQRNS
jgi:hypothetical protein